MEHLWPRRVALVNRHILPQALPFPNCCQYFHLQNQEQTQQEAMLWNKAAFQRLWRLGTTSPQGVLGWVGGFGMWMFHVHGHIIAFHQAWEVKGCFPFPEVRPYCSLWISVPKIRECLWWKGPVPDYPWLSLSLFLAVQIPSEMSAQDAEQLAEAAEMVCSWLSNSREKGWELASSPCGLWLDTPQ